MSLPLNLEDTLNFMAQLKSGTLIGAWNCYIRQGTAYINSWNDTIAGMTQPTDQEIIDAGNDLTVVNGQVFSVWFAENGGNPVATLRRKAREALDKQNAETEALIRALAFVVMDEINLLRAEHSLAARTPAQLRDAIKGKITAGDADI